MKAVLFALAVVSAGINVVTAQASVLEGLIVGMVEDLSMDLQDRGLDPIDIPDETYEYRLPVSNLLHARLDVLELLVEGISEIIINDIDVSVVATRLRFDISLPKLSARLGSVDGQIRFANTVGTGHVSGSLLIEGVRVSGHVRMGIGLGGLSVREVSIDFRVADIKSDLKVVLLGSDLSENVNHALNHEVPFFLTEYKDDINTIIEYYLGEIIADLLPSLRLR